MMALLTELLNQIPIGALVAVLTLLPIMSGLMIYAVRTRAMRRTAILVTAWALTGAALLLFGKGAVTKEVLTFTPQPIAGMEWNLLITIADFILLITFLGIGITRRNLLISVLAIAQIVPMGWFEWMHQGHTEVEPALFADWLTIAMVLVVSIIGSIITVYALPYMRQHEEHLKLTVSTRHRLLMLLLVFLGAMNGLVLSNNLLWMCFFWEVTTLCSFLLIGHDGTGQAQEDAQRALWMNLLGGVSFVAAILLLNENAHTLSVQTLLRQAATPEAKTSALLLPMACLCLAGFTKAAQMPFQNWLLGAMVAPTPVSALLHSSTMVKAGVYLVVRFAPVFHDTYLSSAVAIVGSFTFLSGAFLAIGQTNSKKVLAYSTISNLGLIIACAGLNTPLALAAAVMLIIFHAISKGLLFMAVGVVEHSIWSRDIEDMQGLVGKMPLTTSLMIVGILSMLLPPFGVLIAKLAAIEASANLFPALVLLVIGSTFTVVFWTKWVGRLLTTDPAVTHPRIEHLHSMYFVPLLLLATGAVTFSVCIIPLLTQLIEPAVQQYYVLAHPTGDSIELTGNIVNVPWLIIGAVLLVAVIIALSTARTRPNGVTGAYMCGEQVPVSGGMGFLTAAEEKSGLTIGGLYFEAAMGEQRHAAWIRLAAIAMLLMMFGAAFIPSLLLK